MRRFAQLGAAAGVVGLLLVGPAAMASQSVVYNNIPSPKPGNVPSVGFEATGTSEFGGQVSFAAGGRHHPHLSVVMSSWACQTGTWSSHDCGSAPGATFSEPLTFKVYAVNADNEPGALLGAVTRTFQMPYRPSANFTKCSGSDAGKWYKASTGACYNGKSFIVKVRLGSLELPDNAIVAVAFNTTHYGYNPFGEHTDCYGTDGGCGYDSLNVGTGDSPADVGSQPLPDDAYQNSAFGSMYCDGGLGGAGTFRLDAGCWTGYQPAFKVSAG